METASCKLNSIAKTWKQLILLFKMVYNIFKFLHLASMVQQYKIDMKTDKLHMHKTLF